MKHYKLKKILVAFILFFLLSIFTSTSYSSEVLLGNNAPTYTSIEKTDEEPKLNISSKSCILIDSKTGYIIYSKNANEKMYPASTTKIMTAILCIENSNLNDVVTVSSNAISKIPEGYSVAYLLNNEKISVENLLKVLLIHSANDAANVIAEHVSGSINTFVDLMNKKAIELGCTNTHFVNTNGIHNSNHYTTSSDLALIARYCMQNETFRKIVSSEKCTIPATNKSPKRTYTNTNNSIVKKSEFYRDDCIGIKTGYTSQAGNCIISSVKKDSLEFIAVVLSASKEADRYNDLAKLYTYGYNEYPKILAKIEQEKEEKRKIEQARIEAEQRRLENEAQLLTEKDNTISTRNTADLFVGPTFFDLFINNDITIIVFISVVSLTILILILVIIYLLLKKKKENFVSENIENTTEEIKENNENENEKNEEA